MPRPHLQLLLGQFVDLAHSLPRILGVKVLERLGASAVLRQAVLQQVVLGAGRLPVELLLLGRRGGLLLQRRCQRDHVFGGGSAHDRPLAVQLNLCTAWEGLGWRCGAGSNGGEGTSNHDGRVAPCRTPLPPFPRALAALHSLFLFHPKLMAGVQAGNPSPWMVWLAVRSGVQGFPDLEPSAKATGCEFEKGWERFGHALRLPGERLQCRNDGQVPSG